MRDQVGVWIPAGIAEGIRNNTKPVVTAMTDISDRVASSEISAAIADNRRTLSLGMAEGGGTGETVFNQYNTINSPTELSPYETSRQIRLSTQNLVLQLRK